MILNQEHTKNSTTPILETPRQLADRVGIPLSNIYYLIKSKKLEVIYTTPGKRNPKIPSGAWEDYINSQRQH